MVEAVGVRKSFGRTEVLRGINLEVHRGEVFCIVGPSGSGKSTFLRCINHLERVSAGRLSVDGELVGYRRKGDKLYELREKEIARKRAEIGMVFQRFNLFPHMTAMGNIVEGPLRVKGEPKHEVMERGAEPARPGRSGRSRRRLPPRALGRSAAADRDCARAGDAAQADAVRRAHLGTRPRAGG